jgi:DNA-binding transcriptional LysR family regulator
MQIKALEAALGKPLFIRNTRNLALTPDGHTLLGYARQMLALRDEAWAEMVLPGSQGPGAHRHAGRLRLVLAAAGIEDVLGNLPQSGNPGSRPAQP